MISNTLYDLYGTSASAPVFGAFGTCISPYGFFFDDWSVYAVSLLNSERALSGLPSIGFLNPTLYSGNFTSLFNDITTGSNNCCSYPDESTCCNAGFTAAAEWDPVAGWGSIDFEKFSLIYNQSIPYTVTDDEPTPALSSSIVGVIIVVVVVVAIAIAAVWFCWCMCCRPRYDASLQRPQQPAAANRL
jgi:hypothetical protein